MIWGMLGTLVPSVLLEFSPRFAAFPAVFVFLLFSRPGDIGVPFLAWLDPTLF